MVFGRFICSFESGYFLMELCSSETRTNFRKVCYVSTIPFEVLVGSI